MTLCSCCIPHSVASAAERVVGKLESGKVFDTSRGGFGPFQKPPFEFKLYGNEVIKGWDIGVSQMKEGEVARLTCSPDVAYGRGGAGPIPPDSVLEFEVELIKCMTVEEYNAGA